MKSFNEKKIKAIIQNMPVNYGTISWIGLAQRNFVNGSYYDKKEDAFCINIAKWTKLLIQVKNNKITFKQYGITPKTTFIIDEETFDL